MPVEIRELVIRATIGVEADSSGGGERKPVNKKGDQDREALVSECVEQVLEILRKERER